MGFEYSLTERPSLEQVNAVFASVGRQAVDAAYHSDLTSSMALRTAWSRSCLVGFGRLVEPGSRGSMLADVYVEKREHGKDIGSSIVADLIAYADMRGIPCLWLVPAEDSESFYARFGFQNAGTVLERRQESPRNSMFTLREEKQKKKEKSHGTG